MPDIRYSIVVPLYNKAPHIERAIRSVLAQSLGEWELIVIDDASTDDGPTIARRLLEAEPRARMLSRGVRGPGGYAARNLGIRESRAEWVAFLDADDEWSTQLLEEYDRLRAAFPGAAFVGSAQREIMANGEDALDPYVGRHSRRGPHAIGILDYAREGASGRNPIHTSAVAVRRDLLLQVGGFPEGRCTRGGDRDTWLRLLAMRDFVWSPHLGATYHRDAVNMVTKTTTPTLRTCMDETLEGLISNRELASGRPRGLRRALMRLSNHERRGAIRRRTRLGETGFEDLRCLYVFADPWFAFLVLIAALLPRRLLIGINALREGARGARP